MDHRDIAATLLSNGFQCYYVGGCVRDKLLGNVPKDYDLVTDAKPREIAVLFRGQKLDYSGASFAVMRINDIEVATYRTDVYSGESAGNCTVTEVQTLEEDLARRDFTINAMAMDPVTQEIIDPFCGQKDLKNKTIRFVGNASERIYEDPNRIIRAFRFAALLGFEFHQETIDSIDNNAYLTLLIAKERIYTEISKVLEANKSCEFFNRVSCFHEVAANLLGQSYPLLNLEEIQLEYYTRNKILNFIMMFDVMPGRTLETLLRTMKELTFTNKEIEYCKNIVSMKYPISEFVALVSNANENLYHVRYAIYECKKYGINVLDYLNYLYHNYIFSSYERNIIMQHFVFEQQNNQIAYSLKDLAVNGNDLLEIDIEPVHIGHTLNHLLQKQFSEYLTNERISLLQEVEYYRY